MASTVAVLLLLSAGLFTVTVGYGDDCRSYITSSHERMPSISCSSNSYWKQQHCCGTCDNRYCCSTENSKLSEHDQNLCDWPIMSKSKNSGGETSIISGVAGLVVLIIIITICCCCPCCCIYKMCRKPRPVVGGTHITTVVNTQCVQQPQPVMQAPQYPAYQPVPTQPGYGGQPMQTGPYQGQPYAPGPPPPYHIAASPGYPSSQPPCDGSQAMYPMMPPAQAGPAPLPPETFSQPAYNPAYMQPPQTGY